MISTVLHNTAEQVTHGQLVDLIAASRFNLDDWEVKTDCEPNGKCQADIIAEIDGQLVALGEVETENTVTDARAVEWKKFCESCSRFYLFAPEGTEERVIELIEKYQVECAGLRCYSIDGSKLNVRSIPLCNGHSRCSDHTWWNDLGKVQG